MELKKHIVIYSHGFGVRKDDRGLLSEIAESLPEVESILFDYFTIDETNKTLTTCPPSVQVEMLKKVINDARKANPGAIIDLIAHSQGTVIAALAKPEGIRKTLLLAPVFDMSIERTLKRYASRPDAVINLDGESRLPVLDGLVRVVPAEYWAERKNLKPFIEYNSFAEKTELIVIEANQDNVLEKVDVSELNPKIIQIPIDGDHGFYKEARQPLISLVRKIILE